MYVQLPIQRYIVYGGKYYHTGGKCHAIMNKITSLTLIRIVDRVKCIAFLRIPILKYQLNVV